MPLLLYVFTTSNILRTDIYNVYPVCLGCMRQPSTMFFSEDFERTPPPHRRRRWQRPRCLVVASEPRPNRRLPEVISVYVQYASGFAHNVYTPHPPSLSLSLFLSLTHYFLLAHLSYHKTETKVFYM